MTPEASVPSEKTFRVYGYRWVVLAVFMAANFAVQVLWISYAPITGLAARFYGVRDLDIGMLAMVFMIVFIPLSIPVSWAIDKFGIRRAVGFGAVLMAVFGILRGLAGARYTPALLASIGIALAQPFLMNAWTKVAAQWFAMSERALAVGLATIANIAGTAFGMVLTPVLVKSMSVASIQLAFGVLAAAAAVLFIFLAREKPPTPPCPPGQEERALVLAGLKHALKVVPFWLFLAIAFIGMGIFNGLTTWIEAIVRPRGFSPDQAGTLGALLLVGGIAGAVVLPALSDKKRKRQPFLLWGILLSIPGLAGVAFATQFWLLLLSGFWMGFFMICVYPIGMQYAAEITRPTPEGTSNGIISLFGQASVVFVYLMQALRRGDGSFTPALILSIVLLGVAGLIAAALRDAPRQS